MIDWSKAVTAETHAAARAAADRETIRLRRDAAIASGMTFAGVPVGTDDQSQARVMGAAMSAMLDPSYTVAWKGADGAFVTLTAPQVLDLAQAMRAHVQACFDREAALLAAIAAGGSPDITLGWPGLGAIRLYSDRAEGAAMQRTGTGIYCLTGTGLRDLSGEYPGPGGLTARAVWVDDALSVWVSDAAGVLTDIPAGRWIVIGG